jgi:large subunit ribosomal protein L17
MRHSKKRHKLGVSGPHQASLLANLSVALIENGRIETTLAKAKALRPFIEKVVTLAKKAASASDSARKLHFRRLAISRIRSQSAVARLFDELVEEFSERAGGYTRIYKLGQRIGDAAEMGLIEFIDKADTGYAKVQSEKTAVPADEPATVAVDADTAENVEAPVVENAEVEEVK